MRRIITLWHTLYINTEQNPIRRRTPRKPYPTQYVEEGRSLVLLLLGVFLKNTAQYPYSAQEFVQTDVFLRGVVQP